MDPQQIDDYLDALDAAGVVDIDDETDEVATTDNFEQHRHVYYDTYLGMEADEYHESVAEVFGYESAEAAAEELDRLGVTREEFATYLTLRSELEGRSTDELREMTGLVMEIGPKSPVPEAVTELDDDSYADFVGDRDRAIVTVWKRGCAPCESMKEEIEDLLDAVPEDAAVGGLDGEQCPDFCRAYEVNAAPAIALFADGEVLDVETGYTAPEDVAERCADHYGAPAR